MQYNNPYTPNYYQQYNPAQAYQDRISQMQQQQPQQPPQVNQGLLWVQGEAGAKSYLVAPNATVLLMDSESERFYIKSTDGAGMPSLRTFEYREASNNPVQQQPAAQFVTREEYGNLAAKCEELANEIQSLKKPQTAKTKKEVTDNA